MSLSKINPALKPGLICADASKPFHLGQGYVSPIRARKKVATLSSCWSYYAYRTGTYLNKAINPIYAGVKVTIIAEKVVFRVSGILDEEGRGRKSTLHCLNVPVAYRAPCFKGSTQILEWAKKMSTKIVRGPPALS